jgi:hypothetical protein
MTIIVFGFLFTDRLDLAQIMVQQMSENGSINFVTIASVITPILADRSAKKERLRIAIHSHVMSC